VVCGSVPGMVGISRHNSWPDSTSVPQLAAQACVVEHRSTVGVASLCYLGWFLDGFGRFLVDWGLAKVRSRRICEGAGCPP
jgi:hypothetical protein